MYVRRNRTYDVRVRSMMYHMDVHLHWQAHSTRTQYIVHTYILGWYMSLPAHLHIVFGLHTVHPMLAYVYMYYVRVLYCTVPCAPGQEETLPVFFYLIDTRCTSYYVCTMYYYALAM